MKFQILAILMLFTLTSCAPTIEAVESISAIESSRAVESVAEPEIREPSEWDLLKAATSLLVDSAYAGSTNTTGGDFDQISQFPTKEVLDRYRSLYLSYYLPMLREECLIPETEEFQSRVADIRELMAFEVLEYARLEEYRAANDRVNYMEYIRTMWDRKDLHMNIYQKAMALQTRLVEEGYYDEGLVRNRADALEFLGYDPVEEFNLTIGRP